jgi:EAL domain-containing protein (putative c-di-GMP-specific phosphodiesterase class I)
LCDIAENFGYSIVAEGVETKEQLEKISTTSLKIIQGYLFSKPEPLSTPKPLNMKTPFDKRPKPCS